MNFWGHFTEQVKKIWGNFTVLQKASLTGIAVLAVLGSFVLLWMSQKPNYEPLYTGLDPIDAGAIVAKLKEQKVAYQLADEGKTILVPQEQRYQLRLDMAGKVNINGVVGFESFNETRFGETENDKRVRFLVALQGELTRTIEELEEVATSRVHIAMPSPSLFIRDQKEPSASVLLRLKPYAALKPEQVKSVMAFVSHSIEGLKPENVTVMDVNGNLLSEGLEETGIGVNTPKFTATQLALKQQYDQELSGSIQSMLEKMRGPGTAVVRANVIMDFDQVERHSEIFGNSVLASEHSKEESSTGSGDNTVGGNPADSNMGGPAYGGIAAATTEHQSTELTRNYEVSKTVETTVVAPGKVKQISLSVIIDGDLTAEEQDKITDAVSKAAGLDVSRGDQLALAGIPFNNEQMKLMEEQLAQAEAARARNEYIKLGLILMAVILALAGIYKGLRKLPAFMRQFGQPAFNEAAVSMAGLSAMEVSPLTPELSEAQVLRTRIDKLVQTNPEEVAKVVETWLVEE